jgi:Pregnancy-associated plasma protein-A/Secretion system C-terminal sorting domain
MKLKLLFAILIVQLGFAQQRTCGMQQQMDRIMANPVLKQQYLDLQQQFESEVQRLTLAQEAKNKQSSVNSPNIVIRIPVAVHYPSVVATASNTALQSCLKLLAQRQVNILNADYNGTNTDISLWSSASSFYPGTNTGSMNVSFELATQNHPAGTGLGFPTNGNVAVTFGTDFLSNADNDTTWSGYCNLVVRNIGGGILGYSPLGGSPSSGMTVVIDDQAFGSVMTGSPTTCVGYVPGSPYNLGRTLTHELGHFFNLDHTFVGCGGTNCATSGDRVCDTPPTNTEYYNCVAPGSVSTSCGAIPQLTMNYMDYVEDSCMYMFTAGQATRMTAWYNSIASQLHSNALSNNEFVTSNFSIFPNPSKGTFIIQLKDFANNYSVQVTDSTGRVVYENDFIQTTELSQTIKLNETAAGVYFVAINNNNAIVTKKIIVE